MLSGHVVSCKVGIDSLIFHTEEADRTWPCPLNLFRQVAAQWIMIKSTEIKAHGAKNSIKFTTPPPWMPGSLPFQEDGE